MQTKALSHLKQVGDACQKYARDNDGKFPAKLDELVPKYLPDASLLGCPYPDPKNPVAYDYFGGSTTDAPKTVLAASPAIEGKGRIFYYVDGSAEVKSRSRLKQEK